MIYLTVVGLVSILAFSVTIKLAEGFVDEKALAITRPLTSDDPEQTIVSIAKWAFRNYKQLPDQTPWLYRHSYLLSHRLMPAFLRLKPGSIDILRGGGACDDLSTIVALLMNSAGFEAGQLDVIAPGNGHAVTAVNIGNTWAVIDIYFGVSFSEKGRLISLERLKTLISNGEMPESYVLPLTNDTPDLWYYRRLPDAEFGRQSQIIEYPMKLAFQHGNIQIGEQDGSSADVSRTTERDLMNPHISSFGPRYGRNFRHRFVADPLEAPNGFTLSFHLTEPPDVENLPNASQPADVEGRTITYTIQDPRQGILIDFANMRWTFRNILRKRTWYDVDMISASVD